MNSKLLYTCTVKYGREVHSWLGDEDTRWCLGVNFWDQHCLGYDARDDEEESKRAQYLGALDQLHSMKVTVPAWIDAL